MNKLKYHWAITFLISIVFFFDINPSNGAVNTDQIIPICQIQSSGFFSPYNGEIIRTQGVVFADFDNTSWKGVFIQKDNCDGDVKTSDGIFIYLGNNADFVTKGDLVDVQGVVQEYYGLTEIKADPEGVTILSSNNDLPSVTELDPPPDNDLTLMYFEQLEGMYVNMTASNVVGPTNAYGETWILRSDLGINRVFWDDPQGTGEIVCVDDRGLYKVTPETKVGDQIMDLTGVLDYSFGLYRLQLLESPTVIPFRESTSPEEKTTVIHISRNLSAGQYFTFSTLNMENLFDTFDDPDKDDSVLSATEYQRKLGKLALTLHDELGEPGFIAAQEVENASVLHDLVNRPELYADYDYLWEDGPDRRGLEVAILYKSDLVNVIAFESLQGCTKLFDGLGPDGNRDVENPYNAITCDSDGDSTLDGNRLFSRPPLVIEMEINLGEDETMHLWVINNHWKSKVEDTNEVRYTLPRRIEQAEFIAEIIQEMWNKNRIGNIVVLGDLNDYPGSEPLAVVANTGIKNLMPNVEKTGRYTYIYRGISQVLDHVLVSPSMLVEYLLVEPIHLNVDFPHFYVMQQNTPIRASDHDPIIVNFYLLPEKHYLPLVRH